MQNYIQTFQISLTQQQSRKFGVLLYLLII